MKIKVPDGDMMGWIEMLREGGFSNEEVDVILAFLNKTYFSINKAPLINWVLKQEEDFIYAREKKIFNYEERRQHKIAIEQALAKYL
jgi:hypothetical protein